MGSLHQAAPQARVRGPEPPRPVPLETSPLWGDTVLGAARTFRASEPTLCTRPTCHRMPADPRPTDAQYATAPLPSFVKPQKFMQAHTPPAQAPARQKRTRGLRRARGRWLPGTLSPRKGAETTGRGPFPLPTRQPWPAPGIPPHTRRRSAEQGGAEAPGPVGAAGPSQDGRVRPSKDIRPSPPFALLSKTACTAQLAVTETRLGPPAEGPSGPPVPTAAQPGRSATCSGRTQPVSRGEPHGLSASLPESAAHSGLRDQGREQGLTAGLCVLPPVRDVIPSGCTRRSTECRFQATPGEPCVPVCVPVCVPARVCVIFIAKAGLLTLQNLQLLPRRAAVGSFQHTGATLRRHHLASRPAKPVYQPLCRGWWAGLGVHSRNGGLLGLRKVHEPLMLCQSLTVYRSPGQQGGLERQAEGEAAWPGGGEQGSHTSWWDWAGRLARQVGVKHSTTQDHPFQLPVPPPDPRLH